ncbi:MAG: hypothetical protein ACU0CO_16385 [Shimia sp.]
MSFDKPHELHTRRRGRNLGVALCLVGLIALLFALTTVKIRETGPVEGFDHAPRASALPPIPDETGEATTTTTTTTEQGGN